MQKATALLKTGMKAAGIRRSELSVAIENYAEGVPVAWIEANGVSSALLWCTYGTVMAILVSSGFFEEWAWTPLASEGFSQRWFLLSSTRGLAEVRGRSDTGEAWKVTGY